MVCIALASTDTMLIILTNIATNYAPTLKIIVAILRHRKKSQTSLGRPLLIIIKFEIVSIMILSAIATLVQYRYPGYADSIAGT